MSVVHDYQVDGASRPQPTEIYGIQLYSAAAGSCEIVCRVTRKRLFRATLSLQQNSYPFTFPSPLHCPYGFEVIELSIGTNVLLYVE